MTRDELFDLAEKAGLGFIRHASDKDVNKFEQLADLVASSEREACANLVDHILKEGGGTWGDAIRARGQA